MADITTSSLANILARTYLRQTYLAPHERFMTKFYDAVKDMEDGGDLVGADRRFEIVTGDSHAVAGTAESGDLPTFGAPSSLQAAVSPVTIAGSLAFSDLMLAVGRGEGTVSRMEVIGRYVDMTTRNFYTALNRHTLGHGTGRMAVIQTTTDTLTTFVCRRPECAFQLRKNMTIDFFDTDTSGSKQGATETIASINPETRTVTIGNARTLTAGWGVYKANTSSVSEYGVATNGLRNIVDDGTLSATLFGITRSSNPDVNATVLTASGGLQSYSEALVRKAINRIRTNTGLMPDMIWTNTGIVGEHLNSLTGSRVFQTTGAGVPVYQIGHDEEKIGFMHNGTMIPFKIDMDLPAREMRIVTQRLFRRMVARPANWIGDATGPDGSVTPILLQAPSTTTYSLRRIGGLEWIGNLAHLQPKANSAITEVSDYELCGD